MNQYQVTQTTAEEATTVEAASSLGAVLKAFADNGWEKGFCWQRPAGDGLWFAWWDGRPYTTTAGVWITCAVPGQLGSIPKDASGLPSA